MVISLKRPDFIDFICITYIHIYPVILDDNLQRESHKIMVLLSQTHDCSC